MYNHIRSTWRSSPPALVNEGCSICQGTGWELMPGTGVSQARRCTCTALCRLLELKERVRIPMRFEHCSLDNYCAHTLSQVRALAEARRFAERYPNCGTGLFLSGEPGLGKTHLAVGIVRELLDRFQEDVLFLDFTSLVSSKWHGCQPGARRDPEVGIYKLVSLLILDDFGSLSPTGESLRVTEDLLEARLNARRTTVYTGGAVRCRELFRANPRPGASATQRFLSALDPPLLMRFLADVKVLPIAGEDFRRASSIRSALFQG